MRRPRGDVRDGAAGGDQRLADHLAAEHPLPARLRRAAAEQVHLQRLEIENVEDFLDGGGHDFSVTVSRAQRSTISAFTRVFDPLWRSEVVRCRPGIVMNS